MVYGIILAQTGLDRGYQRALKNLFGKITKFSFFSNRNLSVPEMERLLLEKIGKVKEKEILVFTDIIGSSCWRACLSLLKEKVAGKEIAVITGFNLPMLLRFLHYREKLKLSSLLSSLTEAGKEGIKVIR